MVTRRLRRPLITVGLTAVLASLFPFSALQAMSSPALAASSQSAAPSSSQASRDTHALTPGPLPQRSTRYSTTRYNADHTFTTTVHGSPVNFLDHSGAWHAIDSRLVANSGDGFAYRNAANDFSVLFASHLASPFMRVLVDGQAMDISLQGANPHAAATVSGSSITYKAVAPGVDLTYNVGAEGVEEVVTLSNGQAAANTLHFDLSTPHGTTVHQAKDGTWQFQVPGRAQPLFQIPGAVAAESGAHQADPRQRNARVDVAPAAHGFSAALSIDSNWLHATGRRFPVLLDPTITIQPDSNDASFSAGCSGCTPFVDTGTGRMYIGTDNQSIWREALQFGLGGIPAGVTIQSAGLGIYWDTYCISWTGSGYACSGKSYQIDAHRMTAPWSTSSTTSQVAFDPTVLSSYTLSAAQPTGWMTWNLTSAVQAWYSGSQANDGLYLMLNSEPLSNSGPTPPGMRYTANSALTPELNVTYLSDAVTLNAPSLLHSNGAELSWSEYTGPSGAPFQSYQVHRSTTAGFTPSASTLLTTIDDISVTSFRDTTAAPGATFYYAVVANSSKSNEVRTTLPADGQASMTLQPGAAGPDTYMQYYTGYANCANYGADGTLWVGSDANDVYRSLLSFDLRQIPAGASNISAKLGLWNLSQNSLAMTLHAYPVTRAWQEGTGTVSPATCTGNGATWYESTGGVNWTTAGGDYNSGAASSAVSVAAGQAPQWNWFDVSGMVGQWATGQTPNLGFLVRSDSESLVAGNAARFASGDNTTPSLAPEMTVTYSDGSHAQGPTVSVSSPGPNGTVSGSSVALSAAASDDGAVSQVQLLVDGAVVGTATAAPWTVTWNSTTVANGAHTVSAKATDNAGNVTTSSGVTANVANYGPPTVSVTTPSGGATLTGTTTVTASASAPSGTSVSHVDLYVDNTRLASLGSAPYTYSWNTLDGTVYDGSHTLTARAYDADGESATSAAVSVTLANAVNTQYQATVSPTTAVPQAVVYDPNNASSYATTVSVSNSSRSNWSSSTYLCYRWVSQDTSSSASSDQATPCAGSLALHSGKSGSLKVTVPAPTLGSGVNQAQYQLWFDMYDATAGVWFSAKGNQPSVNWVTVNRALSTKLGLEKYYQYEQQSVGAQMSSLANVANGNALLTWTPFDLPGRGLASVVRLTYNSLEDHSDSLAGNNWSLSASSLTRFGLPLDVHPNNSDTNTSNRWIGFVDGDGTYLRFQGNTDASGNAYYVEPPGVHLYLRQYSTTDTSRWWALTRPDRTTFFYDQNGFPTYVTDKNGNTLSFTVSQISPSDDPGNLKYHVTALTDAGGRAISFTYYDHSTAPKPKIRGLVRSISDHVGHELDFVYNDDGNLAQLVQRGGSNADGSFLADRSWSFTYTASGDGTTQAQNTASESTKIYSVTDPRGNRTVFTYLTSGQDKWKLASVTDRAGNATTYAYNDSTLTTTVTAPLSHVRTYVYDSTGQVTSMSRSVTSTTSVTTGIQWNADLAVTQITEPDSTTRGTNWDDNGYLTDQVDGAGDHAKVGYSYVAVDSGDVSSHWCPSTGTVNGAVCAPRTQAHISQVSSKQDPDGVAAGSGYTWTFTPDSKGNITQVNDPYGHPSYNTYNADGTLAQSTDADGNVVKYTAYDANGLPTSVVDGAGHTTTMSYDADGLMQWTQDPDHQSGCSGCSNPNQYRSYYYYDSFSRLGLTTQPKSTQFAQGTLVETTRRYDANDNVVAAIAPYYSTDAARNTTTVGYDAMDRPTLVTGPDTSADPAGERTRYVYDAAGRTTQVILPLGMQNGTPNNTHTENATFDELDRTLSSTVNHVDSSGVVHADTTWTCYDSMSRVTSVTAPAAGLTSLACPAAAGTPYTSFTSYDNAGRQTSATDPDGFVTRQGYDADSNVTSATDAANVSSTSTYDQLNRLTKTDQPVITGSSPHDAVAEYQYSSVGNLLAVISPRAYDASSDKTTFNNYVTRYHYDGAGRRVQTDLPVSTAYPTQYYVLQAYDPSGYATCTSKPLTSTATACASLAATQKTNVVYDDTGWIYSSQDPGGPTIHFDYDAAGRQSFRAPLNAQGTVDSANQLSWAYYPDGQLQSTKDQKGQPVTYTYNADNVLTSSHNAAGLTDPSQSFVDTQTSLDDLDRVVRTDQKKQSESNWTFSTSAYDANSNLTDETVNGTEASPNGTLVKAGRSLHYDFDQAGRLSDQYDYGTSSASSDDKRLLEQFTATGLESRREVDKSNGTGGWTEQQLTTWDYFANGKLNHTTTTNASGTTLESHTVSYLDPSGIYVDGNRTQDVFTMQQPSGTTAACSPGTCTATYTYDAQDRLVSQNDGHGSTINFSLDPDGNVQSKSVNGSTAESFTYNGDQTATRTAGGTTTDYWYDPIGRLWCVTTTAGSSSDCGPSSGGTANSALVADYEYDYLDRMTSYRAYSAGTATDTSSYVYDALDRAVSESETHPGLSRSTQFSYNGLSSQLTDETLTSGGSTTETKDYSYDPYGHLVGFTDTPYSGGTAGSPTAYSYGTNVHDSVSMLVDPNGGVKASYGYQPYGESDTSLTQGDTSTTSPLNPMRFEAKRYDSGSQSYNTGVRNYSPDAAHFLTQDVFHGALSDLALSGDMLTQDRYALAGGNPLSFLEWDGHMLIADGGGGSDSMPYPTSYSSSSGSSGGGGSSSKPSHSGGSSCGIFSFACDAASSAWNTVSGGVSSAASATWNTTKEVGSGLGSGLLDLGKGAVSLGKLGFECQTGIAIDSGGCTGEVSKIGSYIWNHPGDFFGSLIDYQDFSHGHIARGIGHLLPSVALTVATLGAGGAAAKAGEAAGDAAAAADAAGAASDAASTGAAKAAEGAGDAAGGDSGWMTVRHYTSDLGRQQITAGNGALRPGLWVTRPSDIPLGASQQEIEKLLEIDPGKGANWIDFQVRSSELRIPDNGEFTSGGAWQRQTMNPITIDPMLFEPFWP